MATITINSISIVSLMLIALIALVGINQYLISSISSSTSRGVSITGSVVETGTTPQTEPTQESGSDVVQQIYDEVVPKEGSDAGYGVTFSTNGLKTLSGYWRSIELSGDDQQRLIKIGTSPDTACEFCCGIEERGALQANGNLACTCEHNIAQAGLIKYLIQQGYTDEQILQEIQKWKAYFFPKGYVTEVMLDRGINPESVGLPTQRGGC